MALILENLAPSEALTAVYVALFQRAAAPAGLAFWESALNDISLTEAASDFLSQREATDAHGFLTDPSVTTADAFITSLYDNLFGRVPEAAGPRVLAGRALGEGWAQHGGGCAGAD